MALTIDYTTSTGIPISGSYVRVDRIEIFKKSILRYVAAVFVDKDTEFPVEEIRFTCTYDLNGDNPLAQAYRHLKTLPEFAGAADC